MTTIHQRIAAVGILCLSLMVSAFAQDSVRFKQWIEASTRPLRTIDPADEDFSDLAPLKAMIGSNTIVALGEETHGDGNAMLAKARIAKYLHKEMGFDLIVFENGMFDLYKANRQIVAGTASADLAMRNSLFAVWMESKEFLPLIQYMQAQKDAGTPITVAGMDPYHNGIYAAEDLIDDLRGFLLRRVPETVFADTMLMELDEILSDFNALPKTPDLVLNKLSLETGRPRLFATSADSLRFFSNAQAVIKALDVLASTLPAEKADALYWQQILRNIIASVKIELDYKYNREQLAQNTRDAQMAENIQFLLNQYPGKKMILWGNNYRFIENFSALKYRALAGARPLADLLRERGISIYSIASTAAIGRYGWNNSPSRELIAPPMGSLEDVLMRQGREYALVDMHADTAKMRFYSNALCYVPVKGTWTDAYDAMIFVKSQAPTTVSKRNDDADTRFVPDKSTNVPGRVVDAKTGKPIAYASVSILNTPVGSVTNIKGDFDVKIPFGLSEAMLQVSSIGYETVRLNILEVIIDSAHVTIALKPKGFITETVGISDKAGDLNATKIMRKAIARLDNNFMRSPFSMSIFYRGWRRDNSGTSYLLEAALDFFDTKGNKRSDQRALMRERNYRINQIRRGGFEDWQGRVGEYLVDMSRQDVVRSKNNILSTRRLRYYDLQIESVTEFDAKDVFVISYKCTKPSFYTTGEQYVDSYSGKMYITARPEFAVIRNETNVGYVVQATSSFGRQRNVQITRNLSFTTHYRHNGEFYFLNYARQSLDVAYVSGSTRLADEKVVAEQLVTSIETQNPKEFKGRMDDISTSKAVYNKEFWENYTVMLDAIE